MAEIESIVAKADLETRRQIFKKVIQKVQGIRRNRRIERH